MLASTIIPILTLLHYSLRTAADRSVDDDESIAILDRLLNASIYDKRRRPITRQRGPTVIRVDCYVRSISNLNEIKMEFATDLLIRQRWVDKRLAFDGFAADDYVYGGSSEVARLWTPDLFFANARHGYFHVLAQPNTMLRIYPSGEILFSLRYSLDLSCHMQLELYPFDIQRCHIYLGSFAATTQSQVFEWASPRGSAGGDPVSVNGELRLPKYTFAGHSNSTCDNTHYTGNFSCLKLEMSFHRELGYHITQEYIPNIMLVMASWISFWLDVDAVPARVTLAVTTMLTTFAQHKSIKDTLPPVSYTKAIDIWTGVCTFFVFAALIEFAVVNVFNRRELRYGHATKLMASATHKWKRTMVDRQAHHSNGIPNSRIPGGRKSFDLPYIDEGVVDLPSRTTVTRGDSGVILSVEKGRPTWPRLRTSATESDLRDSAAYLDADGARRPRSNTYVFDIGKPLSANPESGRDRGFWFEARMIDKWSRYIFPATFIAFCIVYCLNYVI